MSFDDIIYTIMKGNPPASEISFTFIEGTTVILEKNKVLDVFGGIEKIIEHLEKNILTNKIDFTFLLRNRFERSKEP